MLYGDIGDQLDEIYSNIETWKARIKSIKDANPKEIKHGIYRTIN